jgi:hypothetical protein
VRLHCSSVLSTDSTLIVVSVEYGRYPAAMIGYTPSDSLMTGTGMSRVGTVGKRKIYRASFFLTRAQVPPL